MTLLFMLPVWQDAFGGWMEQMLLGIASDLGAIAANDAGEDTSWNGRVPVFSLQFPAVSIRYLSRLCELSGLSLMKTARKPDQILKEIIRRSSVTHVYCQYGTYAEKFMNTWRETDLPLFVHFHGYDATFDLRCSNQPEKMRFPSTYLENVKELSRRAIFIANSKFTETLLTRAGISPEHVVVKYLGVPIPREKRMHSAAKSVQILHLGRLVDFKSPDRTIKAFEIARSKGLHGCLQIAGDGPLRTTCELLRMQSPYKDSIHLLGEVNSQNVRKLLSEADILTQHNIPGEISRQSECYGVSIVEAMAGGLPVVGTRHGGVLETMVDGETGILVEPGDVEAQADALLKLSQNPLMRQQMGEAGRARVSALFSQQKEVEQLRAIMQLPQLAS